MKFREIIQLFFFIIVLCLLFVACSKTSSQPIRVGDTIEPFTGKDLNNQNFLLSAYKGKPVIVRFFLLDCPYCKADTPIFNKFYDQYRQQGLEIVYINNNGKTIEDVKKFVQELDIAFPVIFDPEANIAKRYNVKVQPLTLVLSPEHKLLAALLGGVSEAELRELLGTYLQG